MLLFPRVHLYLGALTLRFTSRQPTQTVMSGSSALPVIVPRTSPLETSIDVNECVSILSWNVLADCYFKQGKGDYSHVSTSSPELWNWPQRCELIVRELMSSDADIICLQEVEFQHFDEDLQPALFSAGYAGCMQQNRKRAVGHPQGVATFWKTSKWASVGECHRSRVLVNVLEEKANTGDDNGDADIGDARSSSNSLSDTRGAETAASKNGQEKQRKLAVVNVHLEGAPFKALERVKQLEAALSELQAKHSHQGIVVAGDFNCPLGASASSAYLAFGYLPPGTLEWGSAPVDDLAATAIKPHGYGEAGSSSSSTSSDSTTLVGGLSSALTPPLHHRDPHKFTFMTRPSGGPIAGLDQIWQSDASLLCVGRRALFVGNASREAILGSGLPCLENPSDHVPVGAVLQWRPCSASVELGRGMATSSDGSSTSYSGGGNGAEKVNEVDSMMAIKELLAACPMTEAQRTRFVDTVTVNSHVSMPAKGKPSEEVVALLQAKRVQRDEVLAEVNEDARAVLDQVLKLFKKAGKSKQREISDSLLAITSGDPKSCEQRPAASEE